MEITAEVAKNPPRSRARAVLAAVTLLYACLFLSASLRGQVAFAWPGAWVGLWLASVAALMGRGGEEAPPGLEGHARSPFVGVYAN